MVIGSAGTQMLKTNKAERSIRHDDSYVPDASTFVAILVRKVIIWFRNEQSIAIFFSGAAGVTGNFRH
jgi:hypothetical protein